MFNKIKKFLCSRLLWKATVIHSLATFGGVSSLVTVFNLHFFNAPAFWYQRIVHIILIYIVIVFIILIIKYVRTNNGITIKIRRTSLTIRDGNIFECEGWKVIGFNEFYDTTVDDQIIARQSLNGQFLTYHVDDRDELKKILDHEDKASSLKCYKKQHAGIERTCYPLGYIKIYKSFMLLAFTHFNEHNEAHISNSGYEQCLRNMWKEISRTYANKPIFLPLLGGGITRFDDEAGKSYFSLLKCMICTLKTSSIHINQPINIVLTKEIMDNVNLYDLKGV